MSELHRARYLLKQSLSAVLWSAVLCAFAAASLLPASAQVRSGDSITVLSSKDPVLENALEITTAGTTEAIAWREGGTFTLRLKNRSQETLDLEVQLESCEDSAPKAKSPVFLLSKRKASRGIACSYWQDEPIVIESGGAKDIVVSLEANRDAHPGDYRYSVGLAVVRRARDRYAFYKRPALILEASTRVSVKEVADPLERLKEIIKEEGFISSTALERIEKQYGVAGLQLIATVLLEKEYRERPRRFANWQRLRRSKVPGAATVHTEFLKTRLAIVETNLKSHDAALQLLALGDIALYWPYSKNLFRAAIEDLEQLYPVAQIFAAKQYVQRVGVLSMSQKESYIRAIAAVLLEHEKEREARCEDLYQHYGDRLREGYCNVIAVDSLVMDVSNSLNREEKQALLERVSAHPEYERIEASLMVGEQVADQQRAFIAALKERPNFCPSAKKARGQERTRERKAQRKDKEGDAAAITQE